MFVFRLDTHSGVPPYLQLVQQVRQALLLGFLQPGDRLPAHPARWSRTWRSIRTPSPRRIAQMEQEKLVVSRPGRGQGTFVNEQQSAAMSASTYTSPAPRPGDLAAPRLRRRPRRAGGRRALHVRPSADQE